MARPKKPVAVKPEVAADEDAVIFTAPKASEDSKSNGVTVTFVGDPRGGSDPQFPEYGGLSFPKGKAVSVDADWLKANAKVRSNNHFKVT